MKVEEYRAMAMTAGAEAKPRRRPHHAEEDMQVACRTWFDVRYPMWSRLLHHSPNEGLLPKTAKDGAKRKRMGVRAGFPDFILLLPNGVWPFAAIELKTPQGRLSESQARFAKAVETAGGLYTVVRSFTEFRDLIENYMETVKAVEEDKEA